ncbi:MAG TPA: 6-carboxytetrahydropterin synthase QueD [Armatimonadota bacterium]|nr:6-carboxytetrahydropterin synthase QueD [Armatimonadota bacterium]HQK92470.1 6-carboxytetrahydropterin synthase QueD [Armatimonadota bacterium]
MYELAVEDHFHSAHRVDGYSGKCARLHGHTYLVRAVVAGDELDSLGMLVDFATLRACLKRVLDELDHQLLNDLPLPELAPNPTAEVIARAVHARLASELAADGAVPSTVRLARVEVSESPGAVAVFIGN